MKELIIREALPEDFEFVVSLMEQALTPFYDGDHHAHAERIFQTHIAGSMDKIGHFSFEQKMFILLHREMRVGMINLVGKRQGTYKISPIIVASEFRGKQGFGGLLLKFAEQYAKQKYARQIYCTVAQQNNSALQFFLRKGYIVAGKSESHYMMGITEVMLYKLFLDIAKKERFDRVNISVLPLEEIHKEQVKNLILSKLPKYFLGVDEKWVKTLFEGYERRFSIDVNVKYKLIFVASDRIGNILGVIGATPKKGGPIKIMPCVATDSQAFTALLADAPQLLQEFGHKIYAHLVPSVGETIALQHLGWTLDAVMPGAYHDNYVMQQWSLSLGEKFMRNMRVKNRFFSLMMSGKKSLEVRVGYKNIKHIKPGERIRLVTYSDEGIIRIKDIRRYPTIRAMLEIERADRIVPGLKKKEVFDLLKKIYPPKKERLGIIVLEIEPEQQ